MKRFYITALILLPCLCPLAWSYTNPILYADYSDPDAIRVGKDYYMTASSFNCSPGLPILHSTNLVDWEIISYALSYSIPGGAPLSADGKNYIGSAKRPSPVQHGNQVWAPSIRYHKKMFYIVWGDPDVGIYQVHSSSVYGPWSEPVLLMAGKGFIDACPLWDNDGKCYIVHAFAGTRAGFKSVICVMETDESLTKVITPSQVVYDGHDDAPTSEGPKFYKYGGYYYIFHPAGGVATGWQQVLRAENVYGPYECRRVLAQGTTDINGPHQGAWVTTTKGEEMFLHFQDVGPLGRILHLQPMSWHNGWPVIGSDKDGDGCGEPVMISNVKEKGTAQNNTTDADNRPANILLTADGLSLGLQWQWQAQPDARWFYVNKATGSVRLYSVSQTYADGSLRESDDNLWHRKNLLLMKPDAANETFTARVRLVPDSRYSGERGGIVVMGQAYAALLLDNTPQGMYLRQVENEKAHLDGKETAWAELPANRQEYWLRVRLMTTNEQLQGTTDKQVIAEFEYSVDGTVFMSVGRPFAVRPGQWIGAKVGLFCSRPPRAINDGGWLEVKEFVVEK
ncbi:MAG: family 43 glycosylhydrolase [Paludibacteraceae bacterium]|nr:family 43 glycosylhydrolase [Paludibacteraceae bacterium]